ncbi:hypothetical protein K505DRAFT_247894 [Melanomma pulvis-pyrius CBS 109.77]|uniref:Pentatricopeptide repeat protein n=1 Tax=Melanomma pulvis-pyrius CBS 109.77 TaxID=1314802 RepID=A0A6A6X6Z2_9PLEO|nr:hypothetical protein K505DRAFT_247894 [Melanomma pulvis-pyrius CBS 109.77]
MLALLGPRSLHRPLHSLRTRSLTTRHKRIPAYKTTWDPSTHLSLHPKDSSIQRRPDSQNAAENSARKAERERLRDAHLSQSTVLITRYHSLDAHAYHAIKRLNHFIGLANTKRNDSNLRVELWRAYSLAKYHSRNLPSLIPDKSWEILWATQSVTSLDNPSRELHLEEIYRDMRSAGKSPTVGQRTQYLESMFLNGDEELALKEWEYDHERTDAGSRQDYKPEHLEVGARMHALAGNADRARGIMEDLFDLWPTWDPSIMLAVFRAHTSLESEKHHDMAKAIYLKMKKHLGKKATLEDYDAWLVGFLEARHLRYAKQVFRDMVEDGHLARDLSPQEVEKVLRRLHLLYRLGTDIEKMTSIALHAISILPQVWHSELFGHWMQAATVKQAPEAATQILEMMFTRGNVPQTFHFNLLLRNLLRTKDKGRELKAENISWHMIEKLQRAKEIGTSADGPRKVPPADITTFALAMRHHANHLQWEHVDFLARRMNELELLPNSTILNVLMENQIRQGKYSRAWEIYKSFTNVPEGTRGVFPDGANFRCLWLALRLALGDHETRNDSTLPTPRQLLAETIQWWGMTRSRWDAERFRIGLAAGDHGAVTGLMMHCFSYTKDLPGSLVALHALRKKVDIFPSGKAADVLQKHVAWVDLSRGTAEVRAQHSHSGVFAKRVEKMGRVYHILMQNRFKRMNITGDQFAFMNKTEVGDLELNLLSEFIRVMMKRQYPAEDVEAMIDEARKDIGLPDLSTGDMDAFSVA